MKIYISHADADRPAAEKLAAALRSKGFQVTHPTDVLQVGENVMLKVGQALESFSAIVALLSPRSSTSSWVLHELGHAITAPRFNGRLVPVMLKKTDNFPWILRKLDVVPFDPNIIAERLRHPRRFKTKTARRITSHAVESAA